MPFLTKYRYLDGLFCPLLLWIKIHSPQSIPVTKSNSSQQHIDEGIRIGEIAKNMFPGGIDIPCKNIEENIEFTKDNIQKKRPLFEAGFSFKNCFSRADILVPRNNGWYLIEVKSSTKVKAQHIEDVAFQHYVYTGAGLNIKKAFLMHINRNYVLNGNLDESQLLIQDDITEEVHESLEHMEEKIEIIKKIIESSRPETVIDSKCSSQDKCPLHTQCWEHMPEHNIFTLTYARGKATQLFAKNICAIKHIPSSFSLTQKQSIQRNAVISNQCHIDKEKIKEWLGHLQYPRYYLDFETFQTAIPLYNHTKPYQQIPFQFSLHIQQSPDSAIEHIDFLHQGADDPRPYFGNALKQVLGQKGHIITYSMSFEKSRLKELAKDFPEFSSWVNCVNERIVDLHIPFQKFFYYHPLQKGKTSIKKVLPVLTNQSYDLMDISNGSLASTEFFRINYSSDCSPSEIEKIRKQLRDYCELDTKAMVLIVEKLAQIAEK